MEEDGQSENGVVARARKAVNDGDLAYAEFLYREALRLDTQNAVARMELHKLWESRGPIGSIQAKIGFVYHALRVLIHRSLSNHDGVIAASDEILALNPISDFGLKSMLHAAYAAKYYGLVAMLSDRVMENGCEIADLLAIAHSLFNEHAPDRAVKIAKEVIAMDPDNEDAKDIVWKASVDRHMNSDVKLVTAGGDNRFVPPKIDADKIFIASHKEEKEEKNGESKSGGKK
jgi:tetratricopeptide (TPR) repeat protein